MKQCISKVIQFFTYLWRTLKEYVSKKIHIRHKDIDGDGIKDWDVQILSGNDSHSCKSNEIEEVKHNDIESN